MDQNIILTIAEFVASVAVEGVILGLIFQMISNRSQEKSRQDLNKEMSAIERQNRHNTELIIEELKEVRLDLLSQIKESKK